jgi:hypothetical protein
MGSRVEKRRSNFSLPVVVDRTFAPRHLSPVWLGRSDSFVTSAAVSIATGWNEPVPGRELHPLKSSAFSRRTLSTIDKQLYGFGLLIYPGGDSLSQLRPVPFCS